MAPPSAALTSFSSSMQGNRGDSCIRGSSGINAAFDRANPLFEATLRVEVCRADSDAGQSHQEGSSEVSVRVCLCLLSSEAPSRSRPSKLPSFLPHMCASPKAASRISPNLYRTSAPQCTSLTFPLVALPPPHRALILLPPPYPYPQTDRHRSCPLHSES